MVKYCIHLEDTPPPLLLPPCLAEVCSRVKLISSLRLVLVLLPPVEEDAEAEDELVISPLRNTSSTSPLAWGQS